MESKRRTRQTEQSITEWFSNIKNPEPEDLGREGLLFTDGNSQYKPAYLEWPIEVEESLRPCTISQAKGSNLPESSNSSSEQMENKAIEPENSE